MKPSPLHLDWISFPSASYESVAPDENELAASGLPKPISTSIVAEVQYALDGEHYALLTVENSASDQSRYKFHIEVVAKFSFDLKSAKAAYGDKPELPLYIAANVSRILYASARENIASLTSRAPLGTAMIESVMIEPNDVTISSDAPPKEMLRGLFGFNKHPIFELKDEETIESSEPRKKAPAFARKSRQKK